MMKKSILAGFYSHIPLMDTKADIFDLVFSINYIEFYEDVILNQVESHVYVATIRSYVLASMIPQTHVFLEFIYSLLSTLYHKKCFVMNKLAKNIFQVSSLLIQQALCFPSSISYTHFSEETLFSTFQG